jgi:hypothetical protein
MTRAAWLLLLCLMTGCAPSPDAALWDCQLGVQKGNAGRSTDAIAERGRDITACMEDKGYRLDNSKPACPTGAVDSSCYRAK